MGRRHNEFTAFVTSAVLVFAGGNSAFAAPGPDGPGDAGEVKPIATKLDIPWEVAFLPDGSALFTQRNTGQIMSIKDGRVTEVQLIETNWPTEGDGGLRGLAVSPNYESDRTLYLFYSTMTDNRIVKLRLGEQPRPILTWVRKSKVRNGGRLVFGPDGYLYATTGDAEDPETAQDVESLNGKVLRMTTEGKPAPGNPFGDSLVYSLGHRNPEGLAFDSAGNLYEAELGQNTADEVNLIEPGRNYGWPVCEGGCDHPEFVDPLVTWPTAEASPSGIAVRGDTLYVAALRGQRLWRVPLHADGTAGTPEALLTGQFGRLRTVAPAPDGTLWVTTSNRDRYGRPDDDRIVGVTP